MEQRTAYVRSSPIAVEIRQNGLVARTGSRLATILSMSQLRAAVDSLHPMWGSIVLDPDSPMNDLVEALEANQHGATGWCLVRSVTPCFRASADAVEVGPTAMQARDRVVFERYATDDALSIRMKADLRARPRQSSGGFL